MTNEDLLILRNQLEVMKALSCLTARGLPQAYYKGTEQLQHNIEKTQELVLLFPIKNSLGHEKVSKWWSDFLQPTSWVPKPKVRREKTIDEL